MAFVTTGGTLISRQIATGRTPGEIMEPFIDTSSQVKYGLDDGAIKRAIDGYDVVTTEVKDLRDFPGDANTPLMQYEAAAKLNIDDLYHVFARN